MAEGYHDQLDCLYFYINPCPFSPRATADGFSGRLVAVETWPPFRHCFNFSLPSILFFFPLPPAPVGRLEQPHPRSFVSSPCFSNLVRLLLLSRSLTF